MPKRKSSDQQYQDLRADIDLKALQKNIESYFLNFPDPRVAGKCTYPAWYLFFIIISGYLAGCNTLADIAHFAEIKNTWFNDLLGFAFRPVSYDTLWWLLVRVRPGAFKQLMTEWCSGISPDLRGQILAIDGKRLRGVSNNEHITHLVELFAVEGRLVIAQEAVPDKSCERKALTALLGSVDVSGALISMDAHFTYMEELQIILDKDADYLVGIKGNQGNLEAEVKNYFDQAHAIGYDSEEFRCHTTMEKEHGRIEIRHVCVSNELDWLPQRDDWKLQSLIEVRSERFVNGQTVNAIRYYGCSRTGTPEQFTKWIRGHWEIESLHYVLDVVFKEDQSLANAGHMAENMSLIRRLCSNIIKVFDPGRGMTAARRCATYEPTYLQGLLSRVFAKKC